MNEYLRITKIKAKLFEEGDEDGMSCIPFVSECKWRNKKGKYKDCNNCPLNIPKKPFIILKNGDRQYANFKQEFLCFGNGKRYLMNIGTFKSQYQLIPSSKKIK